MCQNKDCISNLSYYLFINDAINAYFRFTFIVQYLVAAYLKILILWSGCSKVQSYCSVGLHRSKGWMAIYLSCLLLCNRMIKIYTCIFLFFSSCYCTSHYFSIILFVQVRLRTAVLRTLSLTRLGFELMTSRSWQHISCHWDACSNNSPISDYCVRTICTCWLITQPHCITWFLVPRLLFFHLWFTAK